MQTDAYSPIDRLVHKMAFGMPIARGLLHDLETSLYKAQLAQVQVRNPVFITALPRAGTTLLLELLARHGEAVTHSYRDMPFILSPLIWRKLSTRFHVPIAKSERAHDDGMTIDADSPEAFEEVVWLHLAPQNFTPRGIEISTDIPDEVARGLRDHMARLIASRAGAKGTPNRYVAKNNADIARLCALRRHFPDAFFVVPVRHPLDHAQSLLRQHLRFGEIHGEDAFARRYMGDVGHFEFGALHRPILFPGFVEETAQLQPDSLEYWLRYWICAYRHLMQRDDIIWVDMQRFTRDAEIAPLLRQLDLAEDATVIEAARHTVRPITGYEETAPVAPESLRTALSIHAALCDKAAASG